MNNILFICLGSNYNQDLETKFGFIQDHLRKGNKVTVLSVDTKNPPPEQNEINKDAIHVKRIQYFLKDEDENISNFIKQNIPNIELLDEIIICDGIDFFTINIGLNLKEQIEEIVKNSEKIKFFQYISPHYERPSFNYSSLEASGINFSKFIEQKYNLILPLFKDPEKGKAILSQILKQSKQDEKNAYKILKNFLTNAPNILGKNNADFFVNT